MIVDYSMYVACYMGEPIPPEEFPRASAKAERAIYKLTHGMDYNALPEWQQKAYKEAICAQIEYYAIYSTEVSVAGQASPDWTVGKVHVGSGRTAGSTATGATTMIAPGAIAALEQTGLLNPDVQAVDYPPLEWGWW